MNRKLMLLIIVVSFFTFPKKDTIVEYHDYGFTINKSKETIVHHNTGTLMYYSTTSRSITIVFEDSEADIPSNEHVSFYRATTGQILNATGMNFEPPEDIPYGLIAQVFLYKNPSPFPTFTEMLVYPYFWALILGFLFYACAPVMWYFFEIHPRNANFESGYTQEDGEQIRGFGVFLFGVAFVLYLIETLFLR